MKAVNPPESLEGLLSAGYRALSEGAWETGLAHFQGTVDLDATPEALEGLAMAA